MADSLGGWKQSDDCDDCQRRSVDLFGTPRAFKGLGLKLRWGKPDVEQGGGRPAPTSRTDREKRMMKAQKSQFHTMRLPEEYLAQPLALQDANAKSVTQRAQMMLVTVVIWCAAAQAGWWLLHLICGALAMFHEHMTRELTK